MMLALFRLGAYDVGTFLSSAPMMLALFVSASMMLALFCLSAFDADTFAPSSVDLSIGTFSSQRL
jgi:hypothetical protein